MPDTPFHACKHYNKFSEYAAAGIVGVFSDVYPYTRIKAFPECAVFCENTPGDWVRALKALIEDADRREEYRRRAARCARERLSIAASAEELAAGLPDATALDHAAARPLRGWLGPMKAWNLCMRVRTQVRGYGVAGLSDAARKRMRAATKRFRRDGRKAEKE